MAKQVPITFINNSSHLISVETSPRGYEGLEEVPEHQIKEFTGNIIYTFGMKRQEIKPATPLDTKHSKQTRYDLAIKVGLPFWPLKGISMLCWTWQGSQDVAGPSRSQLVSTLIAGNGCRLIVVLKFIWTLFILEITKCNKLSKIFLIQKLRQNCGPTLG